MKTSSNFIHLKLIFHNFINFNETYILGYDEDEMNSKLLCYASNFKVPGCKGIPRIAQMTCQQTKRKGLQLNFIFPLKRVGYILFQEMRGNCQCVQYTYLYINTSTMLTCDICDLWRQTTDNQVLVSSARPAINIPFQQFIWIKETFQV